MFALNKNDPMYEARVMYLEREKEEDLDAVNSFDKNAKAKKRKFQTIEEKIPACSDPRKTKVIIEFNKSEAASIKSIAVRKKLYNKGNYKIYVRELLMLAKLSPKSFIYSLIETLSFPNELVQEIYKMYQIEKILCYHILTDTDSNSLQFVNISDPANTFPECDVRDIIFEIMTKTEIFKRFDTSHSFWKKFDAQKPKRPKKLGLYEVENIDDPCYVTLAVNPKKYFEFFKDCTSNKKIQSYKKGSERNGFQKLCRKDQSS